MTMTIQFDKDAGESYQRTIGKLAGYIADVYLTNGAVHRVEICVRPGCPPPNTMGHAHVRGEHGTVLVLTNSLVTP